MYVFATVCNAFHTAHFLFVSSKKSVSPELFASKLSELNSKTIMHNARTSTQEHAPSLHHSSQCFHQNSDSDAQSNNIDLLELEFICI